MVTLVIATSEAVIPLLLGGVTSPFATIIVMLSETVTAPSDTWKRILVKSPACAGVGVHENVLVVLLKVAPEGRLEAEYVNRSPSGSVAEIVNSSNWFTPVDLLPIALKTGCPFREETVAAPVVTVIEIMKPWVSLS